MKRFLTIVAALSLVLSVVATAQAKQPTPKPGKAKVTICHSTGSTKNPYRKITVPAATAAKHVAHHRDIIGTPGQTLTCPTTALSTRGGGKRLTATLTGTGANAGATGTFTMRTNLGQGMLCYTLTVTGLTGITGSHIHTSIPQLGVAAGGVVVPLTAPTNGSSSGCISVSRDIIKAIMKNPSTFYVNVHTTTSPTGAIQGTLGR